VWKTFKRNIAFITSIMIFLTLIFQGGMVYNKLGELEKKIDFLYDKFFDYINNRQINTIKAIIDTKEVRKNDKI